MPNLKLWSDRELTRLKDDMRQLFDSFCVDYGLPGMHCRDDCMDIGESAERIVVRILVPGLEPEHLRVDVTEMGLIISGHRTTDTEDGTSGTTFSRRIGLPCRVLPGQASARLKEGVLTIELPKCAQGPCTTIPIIKE